MRAPVADDPFAVSFGATFEALDGEGKALSGPITVPGFYDGDGTWRVRFCPPAAGTWTYQTSSSAPDLAGRDGMIRVEDTPAEGAAGTSRHGPIRVSKENPSKFVYADATPYVLLAFECDWLFALDAEDPDDIPNTRRMVEQIANNGFNQVVMNVFAYDAGWGEKDKMKERFNFAQPRVFPFGGSNEDPDHSTLDVEYFQRLDRVIEHLADRGVVAHLMIYVWNKKVNWPESESAADDRYFDYVVKRYQAYPNLIWDISKEALGYGHNDMGYITRRIERLRRLDAHERLLSVHDYDYCEAFPEKVDFISIQAWTPYLYDRMRKVAEDHPGKPVYNIEHGGYERTTHAVFQGAYTDPVACLDRVYQCFFAGTYATYYWQNAAWYNVIYEPETLPEDQRPHYRWYQHVVDLFEQYDFNTLRPTVNPFLPPVLTDGESVWLFYVAQDARGIYGGVPEFTGKTVSIRWMDPFTGEMVDAGTKTFKGAWTGIEQPEGITAPMAVAVLEVVAEQ